MAKNSVAGAGNIIRLYVGALPRGSRTKPVVNTLEADAAIATITTTTAFSAEAGTLAVSALAVGLAAGDQLLFSNGCLVQVTATAAAAATSVSIKVLRMPPNYNDTLVPIPSGSTSKVILLTAGVTNPIGAGTPILWSGGSLVRVGGDVVAGSLILSIIPPTTGYTVAVALGETGTYTALERIEGSTDAPLNLTPNRSDFVLHRDPLGYREGTITSQTGSIAVTANLLDDDMARLIVEYVSTYSIEGRELYCVADYKDDHYEFIGQVSDYQRPSPADGILTVTFTLNMQGAPLVHSSKKVSVG